MAIFDFWKLKPLISSLLKEKGFQFFPEWNRYAEIYLPVEDNAIPHQALPKADFAAQLDNSYLFIEVDTGQGVSHNSAKYFYILDKMKAKPKSVRVLHVLGPGFSVSKNNYVFHKELALFLAERIQEAFKNRFEFSYKQNSEPFNSNEEVLEWLSKELSNP